MKKSSSSSSSGTTSYDECEKRKGKLLGDYGSKGSIRLISELPDDIIHNILCLLPIEEAIRTCVLSKTWQHLWKSMPRLLFHHNDISKMKRFINLVDRVCHLRDPCYPIQSFKFNLLYGTYRDGDSRVINAILGGGLITNVQELCLTVKNKCKVEQPFILPCSIFSSPTLVKLQLRALHIPQLKKGRLVLPDSIFLPNLKLLDLTGLDIITNSTTSLERFLSSPLLEDLIIQNCSFSTGSATPLTICNPNLKKLTFCFLFNKLNNPVSNDMIHPPLRLHNCASLKELVYEGNLVHELRIIGIGHLIDRASLSLGPLSVATHGLKLINSLSTTNKLDLCDCTCHVLDSLGGRQLLFGLARFDNLIELCFNEFGSLGVLIQTMLTKSPSLQSLHLMGLLIEPPLVLVEPMPLCIQTQLKKITLFYVKNADDFIAKLLMTAQLLEQVVLYVDFAWCKVDELKVMVMNLPRISQNTQVLIDDYFIYG